jgi:hypothetical protein
VTLRRGTIDQLVHLQRKKREDYGEEMHTEEMHTEEMHTLLSLSFTHSLTHSPPSLFPPLSLSLSLPLPLSLSDPSSGGCPGESAYRVHEDS